VGGGKGRGPGPTKILRRGKGSKKPEGKERICPQKNKSNKRKQRGGGKGKKEDKLRRVPAISFKGQFGYH